MNIHKLGLAGCAIAGVAVLAFTGSGCNKLKARNQLNTGVQAFKNAQYAEAVENFKKAVDLDPNFPPARLYLATAYMQQYIPGAESPENSGAWVTMCASWNSMAAMRFPPTWPRPPWTGW